MLVHDPKLPTQSFGLDRVARASLPAESLQGRQRVGARQQLQVGEQGGSFVGGHALGRQILGKRLRASGEAFRTREKVRRRHSRRQRAIAPDHLVEEVFQSFGSRQQGRPRGPLDRVAAQPAKLDAVGGVKAQIAGEDFGGPRGIAIRLGVAGAGPHARVADQPLGQRPRQPQTFPAERQIGDAVVDAGDISGRRHDLKAAVEQDRVRVQSARVDGVREHDLAKRLALAGPEPLQGAKQRTEVNAGVGAGAVKGRRILRRQTGFEAIQVHSGRGLRLAARGCPALDVQRPAFVVFRAAVQFEGTRRACLGVIEQNLNRLAWLTGPGFRVRIGQNEWAVQLQVLHYHRTGPLRPDRRQRHGPIEGAGRHQPAEHAMVVEPGRICSRQLRCKLNLAPRRFMPRAEQGMAVGGAPPA